MLRMVRREVAHARCTFRGRGSSGHRLSGAGAWSPGYHRQQRGSQSRRQHRRDQRRGWDRVMSVNARGVFICAKHAVKQMLAQKPAGGVIINMASAAGLIGVERRFPYSTSKGAVISITRSIAIDYATQKSAVTPYVPEQSTPPSSTAILPATSPAASRR